MATGNELRQIRSAGDATVGELAKIIFSAKEAVYKAQYPISEMVLDFLDIELSIDFANGSFGARSAKPGHRLDTILASTVGRFERVGGNVLSVATTRMR